MEVQVNYLAVLIAGVVGMGIGFVWYSHLLFAKPWMKEMGHTKETMAKDQKAMGPWYAVSFVALLVTAFMLTHVMTLSEHFYGYTPLTTGLTTAFFMWIGFIAPVQLTDVIFGSKKVKLFFINTGYQLVTLLAMGVVFAIMR
jgi:hypothetical protein